MAFKTSAKRGECARSPRSRQTWHAQMACLRCRAVELTPKIIPLYINVDHEFPSKYQYVVFVNKLWCSETQPSPHSKLEKCGSLGEAEVGIVSKQLGLCSECWWKNCLWIPIPISWWSDLSGYTKRASKLHEPDTNDRTQSRGMRKMWKHCRVQS
jgi:hypothetical protein